MRPVLLAAALAATSACSPAPGPSQAGPAATFPSQLRGLGTEPFWSLDIDGDKVAYSTADQPEKRSARVARSESAGTLTLAGELSGKAIAATVTAERCSDGMSDRTYPYAVKLRIAGENLQGCARSPD